MKKTLLLFAAFASLVISAKAQTFPNAGFETWRNYSVSTSPFPGSPVLNLQAPDNWYGVDSLVAGVTLLASLGGITIEADQQLFLSTQAHSGINSAEVSTAFIGDDVGNAPGVFSNAQIGIDIEGAISGTPSELLNFVTYTGGTNVSAKVDTVSAWVMTPASNLDSAIINVQAVKTVPGSAGDSTVVLGAGVYMVQPGLTQFVQVKVPVVYATTEIPTKLIVAFISSNIAADTIHAGNSLFVDDVSYTTSGPTSVHQPLFSEDQLIVYPNPSNDVVYFNLNAGVRAQDCVLTVSDVTGKVIFTEKLTQQINAKNVSTWAKGNYFFNLTNTQAGKFENGKFTVK